MIPSETTDVYWLSIIYETSVTDRTGKWLIFCSFNNIDEEWNIIKRSTEKGDLGCSAKVSTRKPHPRSRKDSGVICVYTYDSDNISDVLRVRNKLRILGFTRRLFYKTDQATREGKYGKSSHKYAI